MAKIKLISDIHSEFGWPNSKVPETLSNENVDILVIAGDLSTGFKKRIKRNLRVFCDRFPEVIFVLGNHDHWRSSILDREEQLRNLANRISNLHFLEMDRIQLGGHNFIGATGWFPQKVYGEYIERTWPDFKYIEDGSKTIYERHKKTKKYLVENTQKGDIVITHHIPFSACAHERWAENRSSIFFSSDLEDVVYKEPAFWFFGHTHDFRHLSFGKTEFICNPYGYPEETQILGYQSDLIIDTEL